MALSGRWSDRLVALRLVCPEGSSTGQPPVEKIVEKTVTVDKVVDNPEHLSLISSLQSDNTQIGDLKARIATFESAAPKVVEKIVEKIVEKPVEKIVEKEVIKNVD